MGKKFEEFHKHLSEKVEENNKVQVIVRNNIRDHVNGYIENLKNLLMYQVIDNARRQIKTGLNAIFHTVQRFISPLSETVFSFRSTPKKYTAQACTPRKNTLVLLMSAHSEITSEISLLSHDCDNVVLNMATPGRRYGEEVKPFDSFAMLFASLKRIFGVSDLPIGQKIMAASEYIKIAFPNESTTVNPEIPPEWSEMSTVQTQYYDTEYYFSSLDCDYFSYTGGLYVIQLLEGGYSISSLEFFSYLYGPYFIGKELIKSMPVDNPERMPDLNNIGIAYDLTIPENYAKFRITMQKYEVNLPSTLSNQIIPSVHGGWRYTNIKFSTLLKIAEAFGCNLVCVSRACRGIEKPATLEEIDEIGAVNHAGVEAAKKIKFGGGGKKTKYRHQIHRSKKTKHNRRKKTKRKTHINHYSVRSNTKIY